MCGAGKFFWFLLFNYLTLIYFTFFGMLLLRSHVLAMQL